MPRICTVCAHKKRELIDLAVANQEPAVTIAGRFKVSRPALARHIEHMKALVVAVAERRVTIADRLQDLVVTAIKSLEDAFKQNDHRIRIMAAQVVEKYARLYLDASKDKDDAPNVIRFIEERHPELRDELFAYLRAN